MKNNSKKKCLARLEKTYCRLQVSGLGGVGIFAIRDIPSGTKVFDGCPKQKLFRFSKKELSGLDYEVKKMIDDFFISDQTGFYIPEHGLHGIDISFFLNHSKSPNCRYTDDKFKFVTTKKIKKGEELTSNYAAYDFNFKKSKNFQNLSL